MTASSPIACVHFISEVRLELGGVVTAVLDLCQALADAGHRVTLATCDAADVPAEWTGAKGNSDDGQPRVVELDRSPLTKALGAKLLSGRGLSQFEQAIGDAQVVHLHTPWAPANYQLGRFARRKGLPYVVTVHGMLDDWSMEQKSLKKRLMLNLVARRFFEHATRVHFTAEAERDQASQWVPVEDCGAVAPCLLDLSPYDDLPGPTPALAAFPEIDQAKPRFLFLSRLHPKKGVEFLIRAAALLKQEGQAVQLLIAGPGDDDYVAALRSLIAELDLESECLLLGMVRGDVKRSLFEAADAFVLPTYQENFGLAITEAMACGAPVVTTRGTDIWREVQRGGALIAEQTPESIAEQLRAFCQDAELRSKLGQQGHRFVREWLDGMAVMGAYEAMYRGAIADGPRP